MRILFVAPGTSLHTVRWMNQLTGFGWDVHLFPVEPFPLHPELKNVTLHNVAFRRRAYDEWDIARFDKLGRTISPLGPWQAMWPQVLFDSSLKQTGIPWPFRSGQKAIEDTLSKLIPNRFSRVNRLADVVKRLKPDVVHSLEIASAGSLTLAARRLCSEGFPPWILTNWGSDLYLHGRLSSSKSVINSAVLSCDYYDAECERDIQLARAIGFKGFTLPVIPNSGGLNIDELAEVRQPGPTSSRKLILLKGYQDWAGRALNALKALEILSEHLKGYRIAIFLAPQAVRIAAELMSQRTGIPIEVIPWSTHRSILALHGRARLSIGVSISDGIPGSLLEAMAMGSFPIQSNTSCANEWITDGRTGVLLRNDDPASIAEAIRPSLIDDELVDSAALVNENTISRRANAAVIREKLEMLYQLVSRRMPIPDNSGDAEP